MISGFNIEREIEQLRIAQEFHQGQIERIERRIDELKDEWNNRVSLVTGKIGVGKTTYAVELAYHSMRPVISNLESHEHATYAESREEVRDILEDTSQQYTVLIDDCSAQISAFANSVGEVRAFVEELIDLGHRVILVGHVRSDFAIYERFENSETLAGKIEEYHLPERGVVEYSPCQFAGPDYPEPVETPSSSFDTTEIPEFDFSEPIEEQTEPKYYEGDLILTPEEYDKSDPQTYIRDGFKIVGWYESGDEIVYQISYIPEDDNSGEIFESDIEEKDSIEVVEDGGYIHDYKKNREGDLTTVSGVGLVEEARLNREGYMTVEDLQAATQSNLASVDGIGYALAARIKADVGDSEQDSEEELNLFDPDDWPPQYYIDYLEMELDFNLGQVYGFLDLDRQSQADLAKLAVEYELDRASVQNILNVCRALGALDGDRHTQSARAGDERC